MDMLFNLPQVDPNVDYNKHNEEVKQVWDSFHAGDPIRVPMILGVNPRVLLCNPMYNPKGISFEEYWNDPDVMLRVQLEFAYYRDHCKILHFQCNYRQIDYYLILIFE